MISLTAKTQKSHNTRNAQKPPAHSVFSAVRCSRIAAQAAAEALNLSVVELNS